MRRVMVPADHRAVPKRRSMLAIALNEAGQAREAELGEHHEVTTGDFFTGTMHIKSGNPAEGVRRLEDALRNQGPRSSPEPSATRSTRAPPDGLPAPE